MLRLVQEEDRETAVSLMREFYASPAVLHPVPPSYFERTIDNALQGSPYVELWLMTDEGRAAGYVLLSKSYSNEAGGLVIWLEEIYIREAFRGRQLGSRAVRHIEALYAESAARFRLEVEADNSGAIRLYERLGYRKLPYSQMVKPG